MKKSRITELLKTNDLVIPNSLLMNYKDLKMSEKELMLMAYLMSFDDLIVFDPAYFSKRLGFDMNDIMETISNLSSKKHIEIVVKKEDNKMKEYIDIKSFYEKITLLLIEENQEEEPSEIYSAIETEFGRTLSPIEYETISGWLTANIDESLIKEALKEAVLNGVNNLKYIDKILYEWTKKGYRKSSDVKKKKKKEPEEIDLFDYNWLEEND